MNLREALRKFNREKETKNDFYHIEYEDPNGEIHRIPDNDTNKRRLMEVKVDRYERHEVWCFEASLNLKTGETKSAYATTIRLNYYELIDEFPFLSVTRTKRFHL